MSTKFISDKNHIAKMIIEITSSYPGELLQIAIYLITVSEITHGES